MKMTIKAPIERKHAPWSQQAWCVYREDTQCEERPTKCAKETTMLHSLEELHGLRWWVQKEEYGEKGRKWNNVENDVNM